MSSAVSMDEIIEATLSGILASQKTYEEWSGGEWLWNAPEYLITVKIAESIAAVEKSKFVTMEDGVNYVLGEAKAKGQGKVSEDTRGNGRFDIVVWFANEHPRGIIEVKNRVYMYPNIKDDIKRIRDVVKRKAGESTIKFGMVAFYISNCYKDSAKEKLQRQIDNIFEQAREDVGEMEVLKRQSEIFCEDDSNAYCAVTFIIRHA